MRDYGKVYTSFWSSATIRGLSDDGRILALYLMTSPHTTIIGAFRLPDGYVCEDLQWSIERVSVTLTELFDNGFANRCETTKWVWIRKHLDWNPPENPNQRKSCAKVSQQIPDECGWKLEFMRVCGEVIGIEPPKKANPSQTVTEPFLNQKQEQEQEQNKKQHVSGKPDMPGFVRFWSTWPKSPRKVAKAECAKRWRVKGLEASADQIVAHVESLRQSRQWRDGYEPAPLTFLNQRRWEDGEDSANPEPWFVQLGYGDEKTARSDGHDPRAAA